MNTDLELLNLYFKRAKEGDSSSRDELINKSIHIAPQVFKSLIYGQMKQEDFDDELQEAYVYLIEGIDYMLEHCDVFNVVFLRTYIRNRLINYFIKNKNKNKFNTVSIDDIDNVSSSFDLDVCDDSIIVNDLIKILKDDDQQLIKMKYFEGFTHQEIADKLGISRSRVVRRFKHIFNVLKCKNEVD